MWLGICNKQGVYLSLYIIMKKTLLLVLALAFAAFMARPAAAQNSGEYDVFVPIAKYLKAGDAEKLSAWFSENLEVSISASSRDVSRNQAKQIVKSFFDSHTPREFEITHKAGQGNNKYALGNLNAGGEVFGVTIFVSRKDNSYFIQQLIIEKVD